MLLNHANIEFVDKRYEFSEWPAIKGSFEFGQIPALEVKDAEGNSRLFTQTLSILRYLSIKHGYYPIDNPEKAWECDSALDACNDLITGLLKFRWEKDPDLKILYEK